jgi:hypothetical protein
MSLKDQFNDKYTVRKDNDYVLSLWYSSQGGYVYTSFDFMTRVMVMRTGNGDGGLAVTPFSQLDRDMLINMRDTLVELGGKPPELAAETPASLSPPTKKFNL